MSGNNILAGFGTIAPKRSPTVTLVKYWPTCFSLVAGNTRVCHSTMAVFTEKILYAIKTSTVGSMPARICARRVFHSVQCASHSCPDEPESVLFVSSVWPERTSSAAGVRTSDLVMSFLDRGYRVEYASTSAIDANNRVHVDFLEQQRVGTHTCRANREDEFADMLAHVEPSIVVFDRYYTEEMFSFIVHKHMPHVCRILDMQDVHFLRTWRQECARTAETLDISRDVLESIPPATYTPCVRELASIFRSDMTLVCSPTEVELLHSTFGVNRELLVEAGFFNGASPFQGSTNSFHKRRNVMMIGNFKHPPNADSVEWACGELWHHVRKHLATEFGLGDHDMPWLHVYGSYANNERIISKIGKPETLGIKLCGFAPTLEIMSEYKILFAPLRFGAGLKGKVVDAWHHGLPVVTTVIGSEGMGDAHAPWGGVGSARTGEELVHAVAQLYMDDNMWSDCQSKGFELLSTLYDRDKNLSAIHKAIECRLEDLERFRDSNYLGSMLWLQTMRSTEYFSKWIEEKEKSNFLHTES